MERLWRCRLAWLCKRPQLPRLHRLTHHALCVLRPAGRATNIYTSVPSWCVITDIATPETLAIITTTKPASALPSCTLRLKARCTPKPVSASTHAAQPTAAMVVAALRRCALRVKARCVSVCC